MGPLSAAPSPTAPPVERRLVLHLGMGKTGSSALQVAFARNRAQLERIGVDYLKHVSDAGASEGRTTSGNGSSLIPALCAFDGNAPLSLERARTEFHAFAERVAASSCPTVLLSCEQLYASAYSHFDALIEAVQAAGVRFETVVYVRDLAPFYMSLYSQHVKRSLYAGSLLQFITDGDELDLRAGRFQPRLTYLRQAVGSDRLTVLHYDSEKPELFPRFVQRLFAHRLDAGWSLPPPDVNRSLTRHEIALMIYANRLLTSRDQGKLVSDVLLELPPLSGAAAEITEAEIMLLEEKFADQVAWINREFFDAPRLSVRGPYGAVPLEGECTRLSAEEELLLECLARVVLSIDRDRDEERALIDRQHLLIEQLRAQLAIRTAQRDALASAKHAVSTPTNVPSEARAAPTAPLRARAGSPAPMKCSPAKALQKARTQLLLHRRCAYLRYLHLREGLRETLARQNVETFLAVGCGRGVAETALAIEHPTIHFHLTDVESERTPNYQQALAMAEEWGIPNVTFGVLDVLSPTASRWDLVTSVEMLERLEDDNAAAEALCRLSTGRVFTLVPFSDRVSNADRRLREKVWANHGQFRVGYEETRLHELFPGAELVRGAYWRDAGAKLRDWLQAAEVDAIREDAENLMRSAEADVRHQVPVHLNEAAGIWCLAKAGN